MTKDELQGLLKRALFEPRDMGVVWPAMVEFMGEWLAAQHATSVWDHREDPPCWCVKDLVAQWQKEML